MITVSVKHVLKIAVALAGARQTSSGLKPGRRLGRSIAIATTAVVAAGILWTGARLARDARFYALVGILLLAEGLATMILPDGPRGTDGVTWAGGIGVSSFVIMWLSRHLAAPRTSTTHAVDGFRTLK